MLDMSSVILSVVTDLLGTTDSVEKSLDRLGITDIDPDEVEGNLANLPLSIERCPVCDWWVYTYELIDEELEQVPCESCRGV